MERRFAGHLHEAQKFDTHKCRWMRSVMDKGHMVAWVILNPDAIPDETEQEMIAHYRSLGHKLVNACDGGRGNPGYAHSEDWKAELRETRRGEGNPFYGRKHSAETRAKMSAARSTGEGYFHGRKHTDATLELIRRSKIGKTHDANARKNVSEARQTRLRIRQECIDLIEEFSLPIAYDRNHRTGTIAYWTELLEEIKRQVPHKT